MKAEFAKVQAAVEKDWDKLKEDAADVDSFLTAQESAIAGVTAEVGAAVSAAAPKAGAAVASVETLESKVMSIVITGSGELADATAETAPQTITALRALLPQIKAAADHISTQPATVLANAA